MILRDILKKLEDVETLPLLVVNKYARDAVVTFKGLYKRKKNHSDAGKRGVISKFSYKARRRAMLVLRNIASKMKIEVSLTYPAQYPAFGDVTKKHLKAMREWLRRRHVNIFWILEFQKRGAPHYHLMLDRYVDKDALAWAWYRIVNSGDSNHLKFGTHVGWIRSHEKTASYYMKYITKPHQKHVPDGFGDVGRFWGYTEKLLEMVTYHFKGQAHELARMTRTVRRWYTAKSKTWGYKWKWRGAGFVVWDFELIRKFIEDWCNVEENQKKSKPEGAAMCFSW